MAVLNDMLYTGVKPNVATYNAVFRACLNNGETNKALRVFNDMPTEQRKLLTPETFGALMAACIKSKQAIDAIKVFRKMGDIGVKANAVTYNTLISAYAQSQQLDYAIAVLEEIEKANRDEKAELGLKPDDINKLDLKADVINYNAVIAACVNANQVDKASEVLAKMKADGHHPNVRTYTSLISAYGNTGEPDMARDLLQAMRDDNLQPNVFNYNALISAYEKAADAKRARAIFDQMQKARVPPNIITYSALISAYEKVADANMALELFNAMPKRLKPDVIIYSALISACEKAGLAEKALEKYKDMRRDKVQPNLLTYNALIAACDKGSDWAKQQIPQLLKDMRESNFFQKSLGYIKEAKTLHFHEDRIFCDEKILTKTKTQDHVRGVNAAVAKAIFNYHLAEGHISDQTSFIVGRRGQNLVKAAISQCMKEQGWDPVDATESNRYINYGKLVDRANQQG